MFYPCHRRLDRESIQQFLTTQQQEHLTLLMQNGASEEEQLTFVRKIHEQIVTDRRERQRSSFPLNGNLISLIFLVHPDLNESQPERFISAMNLRDISMMDDSYKAALHGTFLQHRHYSVADPRMRRCPRTPVPQAVQGLSERKRRLRQGQGQKPTRLPEQARKVKYDPGGQLHIWKRLEEQKGKGKKGEETMPPAPSELTWSSDAWCSWENDWYDCSGYTEDAWWTDTAKDCSYTYMAVGLPTPFPLGPNNPLGSVFLTQWEPSASLLSERVDLRNSPSTQAVREHWAHGGL